jgi:hypothetical protein
LDMVSKSLHTACGMYKYRAIRQWKKKKPTRKYF